MKNNLFDEHVKKQFDGYRPEVAPHIWEKIAAAQRRKKPVPFWLSLFANKWMAAALIVAAATGAGLYVSYLHAAKQETAEKVNVTPPNSAAADNTITSIADKGVSPSADDHLQPKNIYCIAEAWRGS